MKRVSLCSYYLRLNDVGLVIKSALVDDGSETV